jgi:hypothetical protein
MSRFALATAFVVSLFSFSASADRAYEPSQFAQPAPAMTHQERYLDRDSVRAALEAKRAQNLARFRAYEATGVFPNNVDSDKTLNVWKDDHGHFCAAANLVVKGGNLALANKVAEQTNFIKLGDVTQGPLMDWMLTSGFTQDEIALIQRPYMPVTQRPRPVEQKPVVDGRMRTAENARLHGLYKQIASQLDKQASKSLDTATDRLMKKPALAWALIDNA